MTPLEAQIVAARAYEAAYLAQARYLDKLVTMTTPHGHRLMPIAAALENHASAHRRAAEIMEAQQSKRAETDGWIIGDGSQTAWRTWQNGFSAWTGKPEEATRYARRIDAEAVHAEDEDAWCVILLSEVIGSKEVDGARECAQSPSGLHQVDTSMESGPNTCFYCDGPMR